MEDKESFYKKLKNQLDETTPFPSDYMYKFIVPSEGNQLNQIQKIFDQKNAVITKRKSKTGKYISVSIVINLINSNAVISYYKKTEKIKGIISL